MTDSIIHLIENADTEDTCSHLKDFNTINEQTFTFADLQTQSRIKLWNILLQKIKTSNNSASTVTCLETLKILSRDKNDLESAISPDLLDTLVKLAGLSIIIEQTDENFFKSAVVAQMTLYNLLLNSKKACSLACGCLRGIMRRLKHFGDPAIPHQVKLFDLRILFVLTFCSEIKIQSTSDPQTHHLIEALGFILRKNKKGQSLSDEEIDLVNAILIVQLNLTLPIEQEEVRRMMNILHDLLLRSAETKTKEERLRSHIVNVLSNMAGSTFDELLTPVDSNSNGAPNVYEGYSMDAIIVLLEFLGTKLDNTAQKDLKITLPPVLKCLFEVCRGNRIIRKYCRQQILPPLRDVYTRPEEGQTLRNKLCRLLTSPNTEVKLQVGTLLFVLCKENVDRMVKYVGYGNAVGFLAFRGLVGGEASGKYSSESEDSDTEEYRSAKDSIDPVQGCYTEPHPNPMEGMTEEQKEYEAEKLVNLMDKLIRDGTFKPMTVGEDGKPREVEHVLQLREDKTRSENDSDS